MNTNINKCCFATGHRPHKKYDTTFMYDFKNPKVLDLKEKLLIELERLILTGVEEFYTGGALGWDQIVFWSVEVLKKKYPNIKNILVLPSKKFNHSWKSKNCNECSYIYPFKEPIKQCTTCIFKNTQQWYYKMIKKADEVIYIEDDKIYNPKNLIFQNYKDICSLLNIRNKYLVDRGKYCVSYFKNISGGTKNCLDYAKIKNRIIINLYNEKEQY